MAVKLEEHENWTVESFWVVLNNERATLEKVYNKIELMTDDEICESLSGYVQGDAEYDNEEDALQCMRMQKLSGICRYTGENTDQTVVRVHGVMVLHNKWTTVDRRVLTSSMGIVDYEVNFDEYPQWVDSSLHEETDEDDE